MKRLSVGVAAVLVLFGAPGVARAVPVGNLDPTFSQDGIVENTSLSNDNSTLVQVDPQSRVIVGAWDAAKNAGVVLRYKATGALDTSWKPFHLQAGYGQISGLVLTGTSTLVATTGIGNRNEGRLIKLNANGGLDKTFGHAGVVKNVGADLFCGVNDVAIGPNGAIFVASTACGGHEWLVAGGILEYSAEGNLLSRFDCPVESDGYVECWWTEAITASANYIYVTGRNTDDNGVGGAVVARLLPNLTLDTSYGTDGYAWLKDIDTGNQDWADDVAVSPQTDETTIIGRTCHLTTCGSFIAQFDSSGNPDLTFQGRVKFGTGDPISSIATAITLQSGGVVVVGSYDACQGGTVTCFGVERLTSTGALDTTFAGTGYVHTLKAPSTASSVRVFNTKIVVGGGQYVARYQG